MSYFRALLMAEWALADCLRTTALKDELFNHCTWHQAAWLPLKYPKCFNIFQCNSMLAWPVVLLLIVSIRQSNTHSNTGSVLVCLWRSVQGWADTVTKRPAILNTNTDSFLPSCFPYNLIKTTEALSAHGLFFFFSILFPHIHHLIFSR